MAGKISKDSLKDKSGIVELFKRNGSDDNATIQWKEK